jgi:iron-sulfur cluster assembly protein
MPVTDQQEDQSLHVTDAAVEHLRGLIAQYPEENLRGLRIFVQKGGCAGLQYGMKLDNPADGDLVVEREEVCVMADPESLQHLTGCTIDYVDDLNDAGFKIQNPRAVRSCGCGTSFETEESPAPDPDASCE